jgi:uncharacterized protein YjiS (DUF1127 family)
MLKIKVKNAFKRVIISLMRSQQRRAAAEILRSLSDRELRDIGIFRCDIDRIVRKK